MPRRAIVTDCEERGALACIRALGRAGIATLAVSSAVGAPANRSRYAADSRLSPSPSAQPADFVASLAAIAADERASVVFPGSENAIDAICAHADQASELVLPWSIASTAQLRDKTRLEAIARQTGIGTPAQTAAGSARELRANPPPVPCVIKPQAPGHGGAVLASTRERLTRALADDSRDGVELVAQEHVEGPLVSLALVVRGEATEPVATFQQRTLETWPRDAGTTSRARSEEVSGDLLEAAVELLRAADHDGFAQVQFILGTSGPVVIDVNCGLPNSLPLATACGANLPVAVLSSSAGAAPEPPVRYRTGVTYRWLEADLMDLSQGEVASLLRRPGSVGAVWASDDPMPSLLHALETVARGIRRLKGGRR